MVIQSTKISMCRVLGLFHLFIFYYIFCFHSFYNYNLIFLFLYFNFTHIRSKHLEVMKNSKFNKLQQKGLEDYKLATANASMNADFGIEDHCHELSHSVAGLSLDSGDAASLKQPPAKPSDKKEKSTSKEV